MTLTYSKLIEIIHSLPEDKQYSDVILVIPLEPDETDDNVVTLDNYGIGKDGSLCQYITLNSFEIDDEGSLYLAM
jgi:hypothetical protein